MLKEEGVTMRKGRVIVCALFAAVMLCTAAGVGLFTAEPAYAAVSKPANLNYVSGYKSVKVTWDKVSGATGYLVAWKDSKNQVHKKNVSAGSSVCVVTGLTTKEPKDWKKRYNVNVFAKQGSSTSAPASISVQPVRKMTISVVMKRTKGRKYKNGVSISLKKGTRVDTDRYAGGAYGVEKQGMKFFFPRIVGKNASADYINKKETVHDGNRNYTKEEAEFFINSYMSKKSYGKKTLLWVSTYCQHVYAFKKVNGAWKVIDGWECSMGKASTPSPTGEKAIVKKIRSRHGIGYWNCYAGMNAMHGVKGNWGKLLGKLASHGCIRNPKDKAEWIYKNCPKRTKVLVF